jgi:hypothetical protein
MSMKCTNTRGMSGAAILGLGMLLLTLQLSACTTERNLYQPEDVDILVVDTQLFVGSSFPAILLSRTAPPEVPFSLATLGEQGAEVMVLENGERALTYVEHPSLRGVYVAPPDASVQLGRQDPRVLADTIYELQVHSSRGEILTATTLTPPPLTVERWPVLDASGEIVLGELRTFQELGEAVYDAPENQIPYTENIVEGWFQRPDVTAFQFALFSLDPGSPLVIDAPFLSEEDIADLDRRVNSPVAELLDGKARLPWLAVYFEGRYKLKIYALDDNWYDLVRSVPELGQGGGGFGGNAGDGFERPIFHVDGGIGLFGSASVDSVGIRVLQQDAN